MPGIRGRIIEKGQSSDQATIGECRHEKYLSSQALRSCPPWLSDTPLPEISVSARREQTPIGGLKRGFFLLSEGPSGMTDPELLGKTPVFPCPE